jgi:hypothetical protein
MRSFPDDAQNTLDASQMRRAGKPTVTTKRGALSTMARLADQEARHKNVLRPKGTSSYDPKTREMRRLSAVVEKLALEQRQSLAAESAAADCLLRRIGPGRRFREGVRGPRGRGER